MDLKTNEFREARASDKITRLAGCEWDPAATAPRFTQFISEVVGGYEDEARYLQKLAGYILSGDRREQRLQILIGDGGDGKSTFIETVKRLMGDYQTTLAATSISAQNTAAIPREPRNRPAPAAWPQRGPALSTAHAEAEQPRYVQGLPRSKLRSRILHDFGSGIDPSWRPSCRPNLSESEHRSACPASPHRTAFRTRPNCLL